MFQVFRYPWWRRKRLYLTFGLLALLAWFYQVSPMRRSDGAMLQALLRRAAAYHPRIGYFDAPQRLLRYAALGPNQGPLVVFIHGAPSSSAFWLRLMTDPQLLQSASILAVDRPGYGYSGYGKPLPSVQQQAAAIAALLRAKRGQHQPIILHGSSYGGTVAARIAMDYPELVDGLLLQSASLKPGAETTYDISYPTTHWSLRWLVPGAFHVANIEKLNHRAQLEAMAPLWPQIRANTIILQGQEDRLIFPANATYAFQRLRNAPSVNLTLVPRARHNLLWKEYPLLVQSLQHLLQCSNPLRTLAQRE